MKQNASDLSSWLTAVLMDEADAMKRLQVIPFPKKIETKAIKLLQHHLLGPRAFRILEKSNHLKFLTQENQESLFRASALGLRQHTWALALMKDLSRNFKAAGLPLMFIKGAMTALKHYQVPQDRSQADVDILIHREDSVEAFRIIQNLGYKPTSEIPRFFANLDKFEFLPMDSQGLPIDVHFNLGHPPYKFKDVWSQTENLDEFLGLNSEFEFSFALYHGLVQHRMQKLGWYFDLLQMKKNLNLRSETTAQLFSDLNLKNAFQFLNRIEDCKFWQEIVTGSIENQTIRLALLRKEIYGHWLDLFKYSLLRQKARLSYRFKSHYPNLIKAKSGA